MRLSGVTVLPQLSAEHMAFGIDHIQGEIEDGTSDLLKTNRRGSYPGFV